MAIRIQGVTPPQFGRITMPKGTYLSNPSTAADGGLGGGSGSVPPGMAPVGLPKVPQINLGQNFQGFTVPSSVSNNSQFNVLKQVINNPASALNPYSGVQQNRSFWQDAKEWFTGTGKYGANPDPFLASFVSPNEKPSGAFNVPSVTSPSNSLVGEGIGAMPSRLDMSTLKQIFPGKDFNQIQEIMSLKGYEWLPYGGGFFANATGTGTDSEKAQQQALSGGLDERGRPIVNPFELGATLEPGQRAVVSGGFGVTGGTPYTDKAGATVAQYAVTYPANGRDQSDKYKLTSTVQKDRDGNWVRIYKYELRKVYTRSHRKKQQGRREEARANQQASNNMDTIAGRETSQLVNLRANYG